MPTPQEYLMNPTLKEVSYDGNPNRIARFGGQGNSLDVFLVSKRGVRTPDGSGKCSIDDVLSHWGDLSEGDRSKLTTIVKDHCSADSYESRRLAEMTRRP
jgi:hypothetical protein